MVYPKTPTTYWSFDHALPFIGKRAAIPPLGLMTVAAMLPADYDVRLIDLNVAPLRRRDVEEADIVFVSAMIVQKRSFEEVVRLCNACAKPVVAGGPYPTSCHDKIKGVDIFVLGEAELTLHRLIADLEAGRPRRVYRESRRIDITCTPPPRFDVVDLAAYDCMPLQYSRGCPYSCEFCDIIELFGRVQRTKTPEQFGREMEAVYQAGFRGHLFVVDDNFVGNRRRTRDLLRAVVEWQRTHGFPFTLSTEASIDLAQDEELLVLMREAAFTMVFVGIETPDAETLAFTSKKQNLKAPVLDSVRKIQSHGLEVTGGFILGFDTDPPDIFDRQIRFIHEAAIPTAMVGLLTALPGTRLCRRLAAEGRLLEDSTGNNTHDLNINFVTRMPRETLVAGYKRVLAEVYRPGPYFERCAELLRRLPETALAVRTVSWSGIRALLLSLLKQGFSSYGLAYLRFLIGVAARRPRHFADAVSAAIKGYHFFAITRHILDADALTCELAETTLSLAGRVEEALRSGRTWLARQLRGNVAVALSRVRRRYQGLTVEGKRRLEQAFHDFEERCSLWLAALCRSGTAVPRSAQVTSLRFGSGPAYTQAEGGKHG